MLKHTQETKALLLPERHSVVEPISLANQNESFLNQEIHQSTGRTFRFDYGSNRWPKDSRGNINWLFRTNIAFEWWILFL